MGDECEGYWAIECRSGIGDHFFGVHGDSEEATIAEWNTRPSPPVEQMGDEAELVERLRVLTGMLFHADAMSLKRKTPNQAETTQITTRESKLLQKALADAIKALSTPRPMGEQPAQSQGIRRRMAEAEARNVGERLFAPIDRQEDQWVLCFDDADMPPEFFSGEGCAAAAIAAWEARNTAWSCTLFRVYGAPVRPTGEEAGEIVAKAVRHGDYAAFEAENFYGDAIDWPLARHIAHIALDALSPIRPMGKEAMELAAQWLDDRARSSRNVIAEEVLREAARDLRAEGDLSSTPAPGLDITNV